MSQRSEKLSRRIGMAEDRQDWLSAKIAELESGIANLDTDRFTDGKSLVEQAKNLRHLRTEVNALRRTCILRDIIVVCLIGLVIAGLFSVRAEVRAMDKPVETRAAVDVLVNGHQEALELGARTATVYWCENTL